MDEIFSLLQNTEICVFVKRKYPREFLLTVGTSKQLNTFIFEMYEWET